MPDQPSRLDSLRSIRNANTDMVFYTAFVALTSGSILVKFVQHLGGSVFWVGLLTAIPSLFGIFQIPGAIWGRRYASYKKFVAPGWLLWRLLYVPLIFLPILAISPSIKLWVVSACMALSYLCVFIANPVFFEWLTELIPATSRGWLFGRRNMLAAPTSAVVGLLGGLIIDHFTTKYKDGTDQVAPIAFSIVIGLAVVAGIIGQFFFLRMHDLKRTTVVRESFGPSIKAFAKPLLDREFRRALLFLAIFSCGVSFANNFFADFAIKNLKMSLSILAIATLFFSAGMIASSKLWGYLGDKYGNKPMLVIAGFGVVLNPIPWILCTPGYSIQNNVFIICCHFFMGVVSSGVAICPFNLLLATANPDDRSNYLGVGMAIQTLTNGIAPILGGMVLLQILPPAGSSLAAVAFAYKTLFAITMGIRFLAVLFVFRVHEPGSSRVSDTLRAIGRTTPRGILALRKLTRSSDVLSRESAIQTVASRNLTLGADQIIRALHDPSPRIRRQAASALSKFEGMTDAVPALVHLLVDHPDLVDDEIIEALGSLGDPSAVPALVKFLESSRSLIRQATAEALGCLGGPEAISALIQSATNPEDSDLRIASIHSLRILEATEASQAIVAGLEDPVASVRAAAAEAVAEMQITSAASALRIALSQYPEENSSELAYALGVVGQIEDARLILVEAEKGVSVITQRRCLLGIARLFGVEQAFYRLILLDDMTRDSALLEMIKGNGPVMSAFEIYMQGDETSALNRLASSVSHSGLSMLAERPVKDSFLLAVCIAAKQ